MLPSEIVYRTFHIGWNDASGTAFSLDVDGRQYLITAKHVIEGFAGRQEIEIFHDGQWKKLQATLVGHSHVDVSVLVLDQILVNPNLSIDTTIGEFFIGQDAFFVGFPLGMQGGVIDSPFPVPLLKKAVISGKSTFDGDAPFFLDGHNNPGFSGAPVYLQIPGQKSYKIAMVVASYTAVKEPVYDKYGNETENTVLLNSGIMAAYSIKYALDVISGNPIGLDVSKF